MATTESTPIETPVVDDVTPSTEATLKPSESTDSTTTTDKNNNNNKKGGKSRRPILPLPDPIPEEPLKPYDPPSKEELQKKVDEENEKLQECYARLNHTRTFKEERQKIRDTTKPAFDAARKEFQQLNEECRSLFEEHKSITSRMRELRENATRNATNSVFKNNELSGAGKDGHEALKDVKNMEDLESRIRHYQYRIETESMPILEEKKIVAKISFLTHKGRDFIREKDESEKNAKAENAARKASRSELEERRKALDIQIDEAKAKLEVKKKIVDKIRGEQQEQEKKLSETTPKIDRGEEKKKIDEHKSRISKLRDDFGVELDKWYLNKRIIVEQQKITRKKKYEAIQAEREEQRKQWEAEQAQYPEPHPYQAEKDMCSGLTVYLKTLLGETIEKPALNLRGSDDASAAAKPSLKSNGGMTREITASGKAIGKSVSAKEDGFSEIAFSDFVKKSGRKGKKARKPANTEANTSATTSTEENSVLKPHSIDYLTAFSNLGIKAPTRLSEVRSALEAVQAKSAFYETAPAPSAEEKEKAEKTKKEGKGNKRGHNNNSNNNNNNGASSSGPTPNGVDLMDGDSSTAFPGLGSDGTGPSKGARNASLPSFKAVASGVAPAPAMTVSPVIEGIENIDVNDTENDSDNNKVDADKEANGEGEGEGEGVKENGTVDDAIDGGNDEKIDAKNTDAKDDDATPAGGITSVAPTATVTEPPMTEA